MSAPVIGYFSVGVFAGALAARSGTGGRMAAMGSALLGAKALDMAASKLLASRKTSVRWQDGALRLTKAVMINRGPDELFAFWRRLENLPRVMSHLESVQVGADDRSHWIMRLPGGVALEWDAEITHEAPDERLAWRSVTGSDVMHSGSVDFKRLQGDRGTQVSVEVRIDVPGSRLRKGVARVFGDWPEQRIAQDLREFKQLMETGEIATTEGQPHGRRSVISRHLP